MTAGGHDTSDLVLEPLQKPLVPPVQALAARNWPAVLLHVTDHVRGNTTYPLVNEVRDQLAEGSRLEERVGVGEHQDLARAQLLSAVERRELPHTRKVEHLGRPGSARGLHGPVL